MAESGCLVDHDTGYPKLCTVQCWILSDAEFDALNARGGGLQRRVAKIFTTIQWVKELTRVTYLDVLLFVC